MNAAQDMNLLEALGIDELEPEDQEELLLDVGAVIFRGTVIRLLERMDEESRETLSKLMESDPSEEQLQAFLNEHTTEADAAAQETVDELTSDILAITGAQPS